jgi:hypothetical protein
VGCGRYDLLDLCSFCIDQGRIDVAALVGDYVSLEQKLADSSTSSEPHVSGTREPVLPLALGALTWQSDIHYVLTTWETVVRSRARLVDTPVCVRAGWAVQRASRTLVAHLDVLASVGPVDILPEGPDGEWMTMTGAEGIIGMGHLHRRIYAVLGLTVLLHNLRGTCPSCYVDGGLRQENGSDTVYCSMCNARRTNGDYQSDLGLRAA